MQFELDEERALLKSSTREFFEKEAPLEQTRSVMENSSEGYSKAFYAQLGDLGYLGLLLAEEAGGMGPVAFAAVLAEAGRVALPGPLLDLLLAVKALAGCDHDEASALCDSAAKGETLVVLARSESLGPVPDGDSEPIATRYRSAIPRGDAAGDTQGGDRSSIAAEQEVTVARWYHERTGWKGSLWVNS